MLHLSLAALEAPGSSLSPESASNRKNLHSLHTAVAKSKRVVVVTGAGISCSSGIPDFRSSDGLYNLVKSRHPNVVLKGKDLFSAGLFRDAETSRIFYAFIAGLKRSIDGALPGPTHHFIKTLDVKGKLLRSYTQNIDGFEEQIGVLGTASAKSNGKKATANEIKNVQLHGDIHSVRCKLCSAQYPCSIDHLDAFLDGTPPDCPDCSARCDARVARNARPLAVGTLRPNIVLYDEPHPLGEEIGLITTKDMGRKPDMLIVMGTSLKVHGIKKLVKNFASTIHATSTNSQPTLDNQTTLPASPVKSQKTNVNPFSSRSPKLVVFVNRTPPPADLAGIIDIWVEGETDSWVSKCETDWRRARPQDWETQPTLLEAFKEAGGENNAWKVNKSGQVSSKAAASKPLKSRSDNHLPSSSPERAAPSLSNSQSHTSLRISISRSKLSAPGSPRKRTTKPDPLPATAVEEFFLLSSSDLDPANVRRSPKKQRKVKHDRDPYDTDMGYEEDEQELMVQRGLLFGSGSNEVDMSLDAIQLADDPAPADPPPVAESIVPVSKPPAPRRMTRASSKLLASQESSSSHPMPVSTLKKMKKKSDSRPKSKRILSKMDAGSG